MRITDQIAALPGWQRSRIDWIRVEWRPDARAVPAVVDARQQWAVIVEWQGLTELADPSADFEGDLAPGVTHRAWVKPDPLVLWRPDGAPIEAELGDLVHSGIIGDAVCDRIEEPGAERVRWRVQAWIGCVARGTLIDGSAAARTLAAAHADVALARCRVTQAEQQLTAAMKVALDDGVGATAAAKALGLSRARVYQIRDGVR